MSESEIQATEKDCWGQKSGAETEHNRVPTNDQNPAPKSENIVSQ